MVNLFTEIQGNFFFQLALLAVIAVGVKQVCKETIRLKKQGFVNVLGWTVVLLGAMAGGLQIGGDETALIAGAVTFCALFFSATIRRTLKSQIALHKFRRKQFEVASNKYFKDIEINKNKSSDSED